MKSGGRNCPPGEARHSTGIPSPPTSVGHPSLTTCLSTRWMSPTSAAPARCWCLVIRSQPITSAQRVAFPPTVRQGCFSANQGEKDLNTYASRRGNHEVMIRGAFANQRLRNHLVPDRRGGWTLDHLDGAERTIYDAATRYRTAGVPLVLLAGKEYGTGSSRDWAAKGTALLGVRAVIAETFERIHRSNLIGMGVLPLQFVPGRRRVLPGPGRRRSVRHRGFGRAR